MGTSLGLTLLFALVPIAALAGQKSPPTCNALVNMKNDLYLATPSGTVLTRFTSDGTTKDYATVSPNGKRVAYVEHSNQENTSYWVGDASGTQGQFPVYTAKAKSTNDYDALGPLMGLYWSSNHVLRLEKHVSPTDSRFEFHRVNNDLTGTARMIGSAAYGDNCAMRHQAGRVACVRGGVVTINGKRVFHVSEFAGKTPMASFTLTKGNSTTTSGNPSFKVKVIGFYKNSVGIKVLLPNGNGGETYLSGSKDVMPLWWNGQRYGFFATVINKATGLVRINVIKGNDVYHKAGFSPAVAWQQHGSGLLLLRQSGSGAMLDLIQPRENSQHGHKGRGKNHEWSLVATALIDVTDSVKNMRFITDSMLLLQTSEGGFRELPVRIHNGSSNKGRPTLTIGTVKPLPTIISVMANDRAARAPVLDWSCKAPHHEVGEGY